MAEPTNEDLMRLADRQVTGAEEERMLEQLANDANLRQRYAVFEATGPALSAVFAPIANDPVPRHLVDLIMGATPADGSAQAASPGPLPGSREGLFADLFGRFSRLLTPQWAPAIATCLLVVGAGIGALLQSSLNSRPETARIGPPAPIGVTLVDGRLEASGVLLRALEHAASGEVVVAIDGHEAPGNAQARLTFKAKTQEFCRQYLTKDHGDQYFAGIACREPSGEWRVRYHVQVPRPASGGKTVLANDPQAALAAVIDKMMAGDALGRKEEADALAKRWQD